MEMLIGAIGVVIAIVFGGVAYWQNRPSQRLAKKALGTLPPLAVRINGSAASNMVWILPFEDQLVFLVDLEIGIFNTSDVSIDDVTVIMEIPTLPYAPDMERAHNAAAAVTKMERAFDPVRGSEVTRVYYKVPSVHPQVGVKIQDQMFLPFSSRINSTVDAVTADKVPVSVDCTYVFGWQISLFVSARDRTPVGHVCTISSLPPDDELVENIDKPNSVFAILAKNKWFESNKEPQPATVLWPGSIVLLGSNDDGMTMKQVILDEATRLDCTYFPGVGYLPVKVTKES